MSDLRLTAKEVEALALVAQGHDAKSAARELDVSTHTIYERLRRAREKLGASNSREAARMFFGRGNFPSDANSAYVLKDSLVSQIPATSYTEPDVRANPDNDPIRGYQARTIIRAVLAELPLRPEGERRFAANAMERIRLIGELSARLAVAFVSISLAALVISNLLNL